MKLNFALMLCWWVSIVIELLAVPLVLDQVGRLKQFSVKLVESRKLGKDKTNTPTEHIVLKF